MAWLIFVVTYLTQPKAVFFTCMDSRMIPTRFTETNVGDMFVGTRPYHDIDLLEYETCCFFFFPDNFTLQFNTMEHYCNVSNVFNVLIWKIFFLWMCRWFCWRNMVWNIPKNKYLTNFFFFKFLKNLKFCQILCFFSKKCR